MVNTDDVEYALVVSRGYHLICTLRAQQSKIRTATVGLLTSGRTNSVGPIAVGISNQLYDARTCVQLDPSFDLVWNICRYVVAAIPNVGTAEARCHPEAYTTAQRCPFQQLDRSCCELTTSIFIDRVRPSIRSLWSCVLIPPSPRSS